MNANRQQRRQLARDNAKLPAVLTPVPPRGTRLKLIGIYAIRQVSTEIVYIGSSVDIQRRWRRHRSDLNCGRHHSIFLQRAWKKYGADDFEFVVLESVDDFHGIRQLEAGWMARFKTTFNDLRPGSLRTVLSHSDETKKRMSASQKERFKKNPAPPISDQQKALISLAHKGSKHSMEARKKMSVSAKARCTPEKMREMQRKAREKRTYGPMSEEQKEKLSKAHKGKKLSQEHRVKISQSLALAHSEGRHRNGFGTIKKAINESQILPEPLAFAWRSECHS